MSSAPLLQCYNKGCGQKYSSEENGESVCQHHPGVPVFHDAYKGWSCCKKRTTDFTEFLHMPGCVRGPHSNEKPPEPEKKVEDPEIMNTEEIKVEVRKPVEPMQRPIETGPRKKLPVSIGQSLKVALEREMEQTHQGKTGSSESIDVIQVGTLCKNGGCGQSFVDESSNHETCCHHPGIPVFHEGMKYWSCCQRKTTDFDNFLQQTGCSSGKHLWIKKDVKKAVCRYDWHQTGNFVFISVFAKMTNPEKTYIEANKTSVFFSVSFGRDQNQFEEEIELYGVIDPEQSTVNMLGTKVEIKLRKAEIMSWKKLAYQSEPKNDVN